jgi:hypothetical protein
MHIYKDKVNEMNGKSRIKLSFDLLNVLE